ncbi:hypothetical protein ACIGXM_34495 [Kitasatospora sp. NPDC052896]|uniref:hypothetical protein n=1 Tax=Kitasatospora sp. NPDC052896 TaxID=3364061 RepID=UPI0037C9B4C2
MSFEDDFSHALREAAEAVPPAPLDLLVASAVRRGRRRRQRRAMVGAAGTVAALACVGALTLQLRSGAAPAAAEVDAAPHPKPVTSVLASPPGTAGATPSAPVSADRLLALFKSKLPADLRLSSPFTLDQTSGPVAAYTATDGNGTGSVEITISHAAPRAIPTASSDYCGKPAIPGCVATAQPDGGELTVQLPPRAASGQQLWSATLNRPDGTTVMVSAGNIPGPDSGRATPYPNGPLLSGTQLSDLALDPLWQQVAAGR